MNIVFDFGGVLFRWQPHEFMARLLPERTRTEADTQALIADFFEGFAGDWGEFDRGTIEVEPLAHRIVARTGLPLADVQAVIATIPHELVPLHDTVALLHRLHQAGHALYYLSNMPAPYAEHLEVNHDFIALFRAGIFSARVNLIKPDPAIFAHATEVFGIEPEQTLFIDDLARNIEAARAAGWQALQFSDAASCEAALVARGLLPDGAHLLSR
ncbi:MAG TPA: HAD family phosphatase [Burkholderiaceae bacterium]